MGRSGAELEVLDFAVAPAGDGLAVLQLRVRLLAGREPRFVTPRLLAGDGGGRPQSVPAADARREAGVEPVWRLRFACPVGTLAARELGLSLGPGLIFDLPAPDDAERGAAAGYAALAREAGELRRAAEEAERAREDAAERAEAAEIVHAELERRLAQEQERADATAARLAAAEEALSIARGEHEAALAGRDRRTAELERRIAGLEREAATLRERELELSRRAETAEQRPPAQRPERRPERRPEPTEPLRPVDEEQDGADPPTEPLLARGPLSERHMAAQWRARAIALGALLVFFVIVLILVLGSR
jgi:hypothetical protein